MKQIIKILMSILTLTSALVITLGAMEKEKKAPEIPALTFTITNEQTTPLLFTFGPYEQRQKMTPARVKVNETITIQSQPQEWETDTQENPYFTLNILNFHGGTTKELLRVLFNKATNMLTIKAHNANQEKSHVINATLPYTLPIKVTNTKIEMGELELKETYRTYELPERLQPKQRINIRGKEFQVPQELIDIRAPALRHITHQQGE